jgi:hypothetical protein
MIRWVRRTGTRDAWAYDGYSSSQEPSFVHEDASSQTLCVLGMRDAAPEGRRGTRQEGHPPALPPPPEPHGKPMT